MRNKLVIIFMLFVLLPLAAIAQIQIKGFVMDETGSPVIGATVIEVDKKTNGTSTNVDGKFSLKVTSAKSKIMIRFIGYKSETLSAGSISENKAIALTQDEHMLAEVQVVNMGFGTKSRVSTVAAISQIDNKAIRQSPASSIQNALVGKLPGLFQMQTSGAPGNDAATLKIRGSIDGSDNKPLVLIDDVESTVEALTQMDPNDVESVSLLKDAGSTAIFGIKGANGVILVSTRRGKEGAAQITLRSDFGVQQPTYKRKNLNSYESLKLIREQAYNGAIKEDGSIDPTFNPTNPLFQPDALDHYRKQDMPFIYPDVDWYDALFKSTSIQTKQTLDITGGTKDVRYFVSIGYLHQDGMLKKYSTEDFNNQYYLKRYNVRANVDIDVTKTTSMKIGVNGVIDEINEPNLPDPRRVAGPRPFFERYRSGTINSWTYPINNENGSFGGISGDASTNPVALLKWGGYNRTFKNNVTGNASIEQKLDFITRGLKVKGLLAVTNNWSFRKNLTRNSFLEYENKNGVLNPCTPDLYILPKLNSSVLPNTVEADSKNYYARLVLNSQIHLNYNRKFGDHNVSALILASWNSSRQGAYTPDNSTGFNSRISYDYKTRYMIELSGAYNGSDKFKALKRYDLFPALGLGWNITEEPLLRDFLKKNLSLDYFKIRGSYGVVGSDYFSSDFASMYVEKYGLGGDKYYYGENPSSTTPMELKQLPNDNVSWSKENKFNIGTDIRLFNNQLGISADYFYNRRYDILKKRGGLPNYAGIPSAALPPNNLGENENKGFDGEITWRSSIGKNIKYYIKGTVSKAVNKIIFMDEPLNLYSNLMMTGNRINRILGYIWDGYYQSFDEIKNGPTDASRTTLRPGDLRYKDVNGPNGVPDGAIDAYDQKAIGQNDPDFTYGCTIGFTYKNFDFSILFQGATGGSISSNTIMEIGNLNGAPVEAHTKRWTYYDQNNNFVTDPSTLIEMNKNAEYPRLGGLNFSQNTFWLRSTDYLRIKNCEIAYSISKSTVKKLGIHAARIYMNGQNLLTWSGLNLYQIDPESANDRDAYTKYPQQRIFNFGLQVTF